MWKRGQFIINRVKRKRRHRLFSVRKQVKLLKGTPKDKGMKEDLIFHVSYWNWTAWNKVASWQMQGYLFYGRIMWEILSNLFVYGINLFMATSRPGKYKSKYKVYDVLQNTQWWCFDGDCSFQWYSKLVFKLFTNKKEKMFNSFVF